MSELALAYAGRETAAGLALGAVVFSVTIGILLSARLYTTTSSGSSVSALGAAAALSLSSGVSEELVVRGMLLRHLVRPFGTYGALAGTSIFFGAAHLGNPSATLAGAIAIALEAGVLLGAVYVVTGRLWVPIALHAAWNFTQGGLFGVSVSGTSFGPSLLVSTPVAGHDVLSGGAFGVEASPVAVITCLMVAVPLLVLAHRTGRIEPPAWRRGSARPIA